VDIAQTPVFQIIVRRTSRAAYRLLPIAYHLAWDRLLLWALVAGGAVLRLSLIAGQRFHGDEAIYGYWAQLVAFGEDPLLLSVPLDKPPLFIYLLAAIFKWFGPTEVAARLISQAASLAAVALTYRLARQLFGQPEALLATAVMALSPFNILFAATAFTDPLMVALVLAALSLAVAGRWGWAGIMAGLAVATKQQGLLFVPLVAATGWLLSGQRRRGWGIVRMGLGLLGVAQLLIGWDALRWRVRASFWEQSAVSHGPIHLVNPWQLGERLVDWSRLLSYMLGSPVLNAVLLLGLPLLLWHGLKAVFAARYDAPAAHADWLLAGFGLQFFLIHWLFSFSAWDRYLLGLVPLASLLLARVVWQGVCAWLRRQSPSLRSVQRPFRSPYSLTPAVHRGAALLKQTCLVGLVLVALLACFRAWIK
jgi:4-amino-4-deoxy-L-arabinose transferase-like glycosyltransferase